MYAAPFEYHAPSTVKEVLSLLAEFRDDAKIISGSQSLVPLMKLRLTSPAHLIDLRKLPGLTGISESGGAVQIGAMTTHASVADSPLIRNKLPMMAEAAVQIGD